MTREDLLADLIERKYLYSPSLERAFGRVDRRDFVPPAFASEAYENYPLPIGFGQTIASPSTVAFMLELLAPKPGDHILEIGAGSGWQTALLGCVISEGMRKPPRSPLVTSIERLLPLVEVAEVNLEKYGLVKKGIARVIQGDGSHGYARYAPYDKLISAAAGNAVHVAWKEQLRVGGRIVVPVGTTIEVHDKISSGDYNIRIYHGFRFVPLVEDGGGDGYSG